MCSAQLFFFSEQQPRGGLLFASAHHWAWDSRVRQKDGGRERLYRVLNTIITSEINKEDRGRQKNDPGCTAAIKRKIVLRL
ncbi:hypothetical protein CEXT_378031 [Caerostris extrusa]|uniref:Uncharacterized protein n=1 Tax=Caerostris extrusa TaxID=172846 RepID=A0AAV4NKI6_CAEEX|nr:hypothetical protein CEXT_378031 [Caerostris extrusa]